MKESKSDLWTLVAIAAFSLILATMLHEHVGHALACFSLGGHLNELGAFYVDCQYDSVTNFGDRIVAFAGPLASFLWVLIGFLNPRGIIIVLISSVASCVGGTSGLAWMMQMLDPKKVTGAEPFVLERSWAWIAASAVFLAFYAAVLGPTIFIK